MSCNLEGAAIPMRDRDPVAAPAPPQRPHRRDVDPDAGRPARADLHAVAEEIARFFVRVRRDQDTEHWDVRLDATLREILERANDFVPSEAGGILLDDPRAKLAGSPAPRLTYIAAFGSGRRDRRRPPHPQRPRLRGPRLLDRAAGPDRSPGAGRSAAGPGAATPATVRSVVGVPIVVGESICGVLQLANRRSGGSYTPRDKELLRIFAAYMSSSIQNALDAIRARAQARIDDLTGLANSRYFHTRLEEEIARADREQTNLSLLFIDLDRFKEVNDRFGHLTGSWTLQKVGKLLGDNAPAGGAGRALRRRRVRRHPPGRRPRSRRADRRGAAAGDRQRRAVRAGDQHPLSRRRCSASPHRWASRRTATTWRRAARSAAARARSAPGRFRHVPRQGARPEPRRGRRARRVATPREAWVSHFSMCSRIIVQLRDESGIARCILTIAAALPVRSGAAEVQVDPLVGEHMVVQRDRPLRVGRHGGARRGA